MDQLTHKVIGYHSSRCIVFCWCSIIAILGICCFAYTDNCKANTANEKSRHYIFGSEYRLKLGATRKSCLAAMDIEHIDFSDISSQFPFEARLLFLKQLSVEVWRYNRDDKLAKDRLVVAVFDNTSDLLTDLFVLNNGTYLVPIIGGTYNTNLHELNKGDSINKIFSLLGKTQPMRYYQKGEMWFVDFEYPGIQSDWWVITVDAASGYIYEIKNCGI